MTMEHTNNTPQELTRKRQGAAKQDFMGSKAFHTGGLALAEALAVKSPASKRLNATGMKMLPPIKTACTSLERQSGASGYATTTNQNRRNLLQLAKSTRNTDVSKFENMKRSTIRAAKRTRVGNHHQLSVGKSTQMRQAGAANQLLIDSQAAVRAHDSPSTCEDSQRVTLSSKDNQSSGLRSNENFCSSPLAHPVGLALDNQPTTLLVDPSHEMALRWQQKVNQNVPPVDIADIRAEKDLLGEGKRQFAPEYSQTSYLTAISQEFAIGDYINERNSTIKVSEEARRHMVTLLEELNRLKSYKEETFYLALSLADRYLMSLAMKMEKAPCLIRLAIVSTLMSAKLEQPISPSFNRMVRLVQDEWGVTVTKPELINLEEKIIRALDFSLHTVSPIVFLERYQRIFGVDREAADEEAAQVGGLARSLCRVMAGHSSFLRFKSSQVAASALLLAINISVSPVSALVGLPKQLVDLPARSAYADLSNPAVAKNPMRHWNAGVHSLTFRHAGKDILPCYKMLLTLANELEFQGLLGKDAGIFPIAFSSTNSPAKQFHAKYY